MELFPHNGTHNSRIKEGISSVVSVYWIPRGDTGFESQLLEKAQGANGADVDAP